MGKLRRMQESDAPLVEEIYNKGFGAHTIARKLGLKYDSVQGYLRSKGMTRKKGSEEFIKAMSDTKKGLKYDRTDHEYEQNNKISL